VRLERRRTAPVGAPDRRSTYGLQHQARLAGRAAQVDAAGPSRPRRPELEHSFGSRRIRCSS